MPLTGIQTVALSAIKAALEVEPARMNCAGDRIDMLEDEFKALVNKRVEERFSSGSWDKLKMYIDTSLNLFGSINEQISEIYIDDPSRVFRRGDIVKGEEVEYLNEVYKKGKVNQTLERVNLYMNAVNDVLIGPVYRSDKLEFDIITPNICRVITDPDDITRPICIMVKREVAGASAGETADEWVVWTETEHYILDKDLNQRAVEGNEEMKNPFNRLPFVWVHRKKSDAGFWNVSAGEDLFQATLEICAKRSLENFYFVWQSLKALWARYTGDLAEGLVLSPDTVIQLKDDPDAEIGVIDFQTAFDKMDEHIDRYGSGPARRYGVDIHQYMASMKEASGIALKIRNTVLERIRKKQIKVFRDLEADLFELILVFIAYYEKRNFEGVELFVDFASMEQRVDEKEVLAVLKMELELNLVDLVVAFQGRNPDYKDYEDAKKEVIKIIKSNNELRGMVDIPIDGVLNKKAPVVDPE